MRSDKEIEMLKELTGKYKEFEREIEIHSLSGYSTTQLKAELRRRKGERKQ